MVSFDEQAILDNGAYIYNQRAEIERIADEICEKGFDSIFFTSSGGSRRQRRQKTQAAPLSLRLAWTVHRLVNFPIME